MIKILDICSGIGGFSLGLEATGGFDTVAFCEFDDFCCKVLNKHWPNVPIYKDLKEIGNDPARIIQEFDLICGGIPCQPFSLAGKQKGKEDDRHLWPYMYAIVKSKKPTWVIVENVGGFVNVALDDVCLDLETQGYATQSFIIPACSVEAPHKRDRIWILGKLMANAHDTGDRTPGSKADEDRQETIEGWQEQSQLGSSRSSNDVANAQSNGEDGVLRTTEPKHDQGDTRMESSSSSDGRSERGISQDVADPKLVSSDSISDSGSNTKTESEQGQKTGNLDRSSGRQNVANSKSSQSGEQTQWEGGEDTQRGSVNSGGLENKGREDVPNASSQRLEGHRGEHGLRGTSQEEQTSRSSEEQDVPNPKELRNYEHDNGERTQQDREHRVSQQPRGERGFEGTKQDVADTERLRQQGQGELERPGNTAQDSDGQTGGSNDGRQGSTGQGHTQSELGGVADGIPTRLDGHLGFEREPNIPRVATGIPDRVNRLKALGNSIVPQIVYNIGLAILEEEKRTNVTK
jgi:DNA (cytosine-5)-methyltransferase 1